jgi:hypothetical protein
MPVTAVEVAAMIRVMIMITARKVRPVPMEAVVTPIVIQLHIVLEAVPAVVTLVMVAIIVM